MKLNLVNKVYLTIAVAIAAAVVVKQIRYNAGGRYYYAAGVCAPQTFPVYVREAYLITANDENVHVDTEDVNYFKGSWRSTHFFPEATESNLVPEKLVLNYAGFRDADFYSDTILLPGEKIRDLFKITLKNNSGDEIYYRGQQKQGLSFMIGIANKGNIIVWARDKNGETEILRTKINAREPGEQDTYFGEKMTKAAYLEDRFSLLSDSIKTLIRSGFDAGANYIDSAALH